MYFVIGSACERGVYCMYYFMLIGLIIDGSFLIVRGWCTV